MRFDSKDHAARDVDQRIERLDVIGEHLGQRAADHERIKSLLQDLKDGGTTEVMEAVEAGVRDARVDVREHFEAEHHELEHEQGKAEQLEQEVQNESRIDTDNAEEIAEARAELNTESAAEHLEQAIDQLKTEAEVLDAQAERLHDHTATSLEEAHRLVRRVMQGE